jgi:uncharacterized protein YcbX
MTSAVGTISSLSRFPVKSMLGEALDTAEVGPGGIAGDRAYAIVDRETGKVASAKHPKVWPDLLACRAIFTEEPVAGAEAPPAELELKDGTTVRTDAADVDDVLSRFFGRGVELARSAPEDFTIDQYHPDLENLDPQGHRDELTESKLGAALFREMGAPSAVPEGSFLDVCPLSVLSTSTLQRLGELQPDSRFDPRRFRMNVIVDTSVDGFAENAWIGHTLALGDDVRIVAIMPDPRCVMTTVAQGDLPRDPQILKALAQHNRLDVAGGGLYPCAGVYAVTESGGAIRTGDPVALV